MNIKTLRPNMGIEADRYIELLGKKTTKLIRKNTPLKKDIIKFLK